MMADVMIGIDPHKSSHTAVAIGSGEESLGEVRVRACAVQAERLLAWAVPWPGRTWAIGGADGVGHLLAQLLLRQPDRHRGMRGLVRVDPDHHFRHQHTPDRSHRTGSRGGHA